MSIAARKSSDELAWLPLERLAALVAGRKVSPVELVESALARIERLNPRINAFLTVTAEEARAAARIAEREIGRGRYRGPLHGIPISLKDNIATRGVRTTAGSKILADFLPAEDAAAAQKLRRAGAILLGKTNMHEFAYGVTTENPHYGAARNPWALDRITGGSSGGSAAALAAGMGWGSLGSDTGGSIRIPAALCGVVGLKPTFGRVSGSGVVPLSRSLDHVGPLASSVAGVALLLSAVAGSDPRDELAAATRPVPDYSAGLRRRRLAGLRLGRPREFFFARVDQGVRRAVESAAGEFERLGARILEVSLPHVAGSLDPSAEIAMAEATAYHLGAGYFPARAGDYGEDVRRLLERGLQVRAVDFLAALETRKAVAADFDSAWGQVDLLFAPVTPIAAPRLGARLVRVGSSEETVRAALLRLCRPANFAGIPAISLPCGFTGEGLPVGLQLLARPWDEARLLRAASAYERAAGWQNRHPPGL
jgi:aspartyl-tRNA(Asn)/glutamyl-tRNA(Gln) amidotransferase subunit A